MEAFYCYVILYALCLLTVAATKVSMPWLFSCGLLVYGSALFAGFSIYPSIFGVSYVFFDEYVYWFYSYLLILSMIATVFRSAKHHRIQNGALSIPVSARFTLPASLFSATTLLALSYLSGELTGIFTDKTDILQNASRLFVYFDVFTTVSLILSIQWFLHSEKSRLSTIYLGASISLSMILVLNGFRTPIAVAAATYVCFTVYGSRVKWRITWILMLALFFFSVYVSKDLVSSIREERSINVFSSEYWTLTLVMNEFSMLATVVDRVLTSFHGIVEGRFIEYGYGLLGVLLPIGFNVNTLGFYYMVLFPEVNYGITSGVFLDFYLAGGQISFLLNSALFVAVLCLLDQKFGRRDCSYFWATVILLCFLGMLSGLRSDFLMSITYGKRLLYAFFLVYGFSQVFSWTLRNRAPSLGGN